LKWRGISVRAPSVLIAVIFAVGAVACSSSGAQPSSTATPTPQLATPLESGAVVTGRPTNAWYGQVQAALFAAPGLLDHISMTDIDEGNDQIVIGVDTEDAQRAAEQEIAKLGLPPDAVMVIIQSFVVAD
jgi:hypothetical protein